MIMQVKDKKKSNATLWDKETLQKKLGQLMMIGFAGPQLNQNEIEFIKKVDPAGVIYFRRNLETPEQSSQLSHSVWSLFKTSPFIGIDQEGGRVERLSKPFTHFPGNLHLGTHYQSSQSSKLARQQIVALCTELKSIGVNLDFSPVADIHTNENNPIINDRAFSTKEKVVSNLVGISVDTFNQQNMLSCAKHFPGHGDTLLDSHLALPNVDTNIKTLFGRELKPFIRAIAYKVPMIMTAHIIYNKIDKKRMATLSPFFLQSILRKRLKYKGIIVSDDLEMHAVAKNKNLADAAVEALNAGVDMLLVCKSLEESYNVYERIVKALQSSELDPLKLQQSVERIAAVKRRFLHSGPKHYTKDYAWPKHFSLSETIQNLPST